MDIHRNGIEIKLTEFWPIEHPVEPMEEDRPIECPKIPDTSVINDENSYDEESYEKLNRKENLPVVIEEEELLPDKNTHRRSIRKRPHNHTETDNDSVAAAAAVATAFFKISPLLPLPPSNIHNHKFG